MTTERISLIPTDPRWRPRTGARSSSSTCACPAVARTPPLNDLCYRRPAGFASAELRVTAPGRGRLEATELVAVEARYGHALRQVWARY